MRVFDAEDGSSMGRQYAGGDYREAFREYIHGATSVTSQGNPILRTNVSDNFPVPCWLSSSDSICSGPETIVDIVNPRDWCCDAGYTRATPNSYTGCVLENEIDVGGIEWVDSNFPRDSALSYVVW